MKHSATIPMPFARRKTPSKKSLRSKIAGLWSEVVYLREHNKQLKRENGNLRRALHTKGRA